MNIKLVYQSLTGNTKKLAEAIALTLNIQAKSIEENTFSSNPTDLLFIGGGVYFGKINKKLLSFINNLNSEIVKHAVVFATCGEPTRIGYA